MKSASVLVISGPTGSGETTITKEIIKRYPNFKKLVASTTRSPRAFEKEGIDYNFFSKERFENEIKNGNIIEWTYIKNRGVYYGTFKPFLEENIKNGFTLIANTDVVGTRFFKKKFNATTIFVEPKSIEELKNRLIKREPNISDEELKKRLTNAEAEIKNEKSVYDYSVVNENEKLSKAVNEIVDILKKEGYALS